MVGGIYLGLIGVNAKRLKEVGDLFGKREKDKISKKSIINEEL